MEALVSPKILVWARSTAGLSADEAAKKANISISTLERAERGNGRISTAQLEKLANVYKRPLAAFYLSEPPESPVLLPDFRRLPGGGLREVSPLLTLELRRARQRREETLKLANELDEDLPKFDARYSLKDSITHVAATLRAALDVSLDTQFGWRSSDKALKIWKTAVERAGVLVFEMSRVQTSEVRGVAIHFETLPIIILNGADAPTARIFSLFHELAHIGLGVSAIDDGSESKAGLNDLESRIEVFCNGVAAEILVPEAALAARIDSVSESTAVGQIGETAKAFSVSREVIARRLLTLGRIEPKQYEKLQEQFRIEYVSFLADKKKKSSGAPSPTVIQARNLSRTLSRQALSAYEQDQLSLNGISEILGVRARAVGDFREIVRREVAA
jgi:Zn-dependent peptidase ImmA (M78 family)/transcriptional regulator with XRE-family HTH domain